MNNDDEVFQKDIVSAAAAFFIHWLEAPVVYKPTFSIEIKGDVVTTCLNGHVVEFTLREWRLALYAEHNYLSYVGAMKMVNIVNSFGKPVAPKPKPQKIQNGPVSFMVRKVSGLN